MPITSSGGDASALAGPSADDDMSKMMKRMSHNVAMTFAAPIAVVAAIAATAVVASSPVSAQILAPPNPMLTVPPPPAPVSPRIEVPVVPKLDAMPPQPTAQLSRRSFGDRVTGCLQDGAAAGLSPSDRSAYSRGCANQ
jgi:hypothetical protein